MRSLPFIIDDLNGGFMKLEGILRVEAGVLNFEFQKKDAILEAYKSEVKTLEIPFNDLDMMEYKKGWFSSKLIIHGKRAAVFQDLPGNELTERILKVKRKYRELAANISSNVNLVLSEQKLRDMDDQ